MTDISSRRVSLYRLVFHKDMLRQLDSFTENVERCNFTTRDGWQKTYVEKDGHNVDEYKPSFLRAVDALDICYIRFTDYLVLTEKQFADYQFLMSHIDCIRTGTACTTCAYVGA